MAAAGNGWSWAQTTVLIAAIIAIIGTTITTALTYALNQRAARRDRQARDFAEALGVIEDYAEMPYRIRRRQPTDEARHALTERISQIQSRIAFHQGWLQIEAPAVAASYDLLVRAAKRQAGGQMKDAWAQRPAVKDQHMSLDVAYERSEIDQARERCIIVMRRELGRGSRPWASIVVPGEAISRTAAGGAIR